MEWAKNPIKKNYFIFLWYVLLVFAIYFFIYSIINKEINSSYYFLLIAVFCIYRCFFRGKILLSKHFKILTINQRANEWDRIIQFADDITVLDGNTTIDYKWSQIEALIDTKNYLILVLQKGLGIRLDKKGFSIGSYEAFLEHIKNNYPSISLSTKK